MSRLQKWLLPVATMAVVILSAVLSHYATLAGQPRPQSALRIFGAYWLRPSYIYLESRYNEPFSGIYFPYYFDDEAEVVEFAQQQGENIVFSNSESIGGGVFWDRLQILRLIEDKEMSFDESEWLYRVTLSYIPYTRHLDAEAYRQEYYELYDQEVTPDTTFLVGKDGRIFYNGKTYILPGEERSNGVDQLFNLEFKASRRYIVGWQEES